LRDVWTIMRERPADSRVDCAKMRGPLWRRPVPSLHNEPIAVKNQGGRVSHVDSEIASQPVCWARAVELAARSADALPARGERVAVLGCGTSWFMAMAYARLREAAGHGETDACAASEFPAGRRYDRVLAITRS